MNKKIILITGCNGYISNVIIKNLKNDNILFIGCDLHTSNDKKSLNTINNGLYIYYKCDISKENQISKLFNKLKSKNIFPTILINNAAIDSVPVAGVTNEKFNVNDFDLIFRVNVRAPIIFSKLCIENWEKNRKKGIIINITSIYSLISPDPKLYSNNFIKNILYGSSKAALNNISKQMAVICAKNNIKINSILFAGFESDKQDEKFKTKYCNRIPIGRMLNENDIKETVSFLISENNEYMTGSTITLDGGYSLI
jgi:NAD(P)-dependent dehydrogenase (short-subunit alcohol dehydrogenase family)